MGNHAGHAESGKRDFDRLAQTSGLSRAEIEKFYSDYVRASGRDGVMDVNEFIQLYSTLPTARSLSEGAMKDQATRIFRAFDQDHNGILSFDEFLTAVVMMNSQVPESDRIDFLIQENNVFAREKNMKQITKQYGLQIFRHLNDFHGLPSGTEHRHWKELDQSNRGYVTQEELLEYIGRQAIYNR